MKKIISITLFLGVLVLLGCALPVLAKNDGRPKGLEDRGPLTKITFIHYRKGQAKPPWAGGDKGKGESKCYEFLARGAKWKTVEDYYINPTNDDNLNKSFVKNAVNLGIAEWENYGGDIFGDGSVNHKVGYNYGNYDGINTASFGPYSDPGVIAVTTIWGYFSGPPPTRELVEWDMLFNDASTWEWGDGATDSGLMDLQNIATHELGHSAGMGDLYRTTCDLETMYGYSTEGETIKRDLELPDITGIQKLYEAF